MADSARSILDQTGQTEEELVDYLRSQGIKGVRVSSGHCPLANLLTRQTGYTGSVGTNDAMVHENHQRIVSECSLKEHETSFVHNFDAGHYPDLIETWPFKEI